MPDVNVTYAGLPLVGPIIVEPAGATFLPETAAAVSEAGAGAIILPVLDEDRLTHHDPDDDVSPSNLDDASVRQTERIVRRLNQDAYLRLIADIVAASDRPVIGSLYSTNRRGWLPVAHMMVDAGAAAVELVPVREAELRTLRSDQVEAQLLRGVTVVAERLGAPAIVRLPALTWGMQALVQTLGDGGVKGIVVRPPDSMQSVNIETNALVEAPDATATQAGFLTVMRALRILYRRVASHIAASIPPEDDTALAASIVAGATLGIIAVDGEDPEGAAAMVRRHHEAVVTWMEHHNLSSLFDIRGTTSESRLTNSLER